MKFDVHYLFSAKYARWIIIACIALFSILIIKEFANLFFPLTPETISDINNGKDMPVSQNSMLELSESSLFGVYVPHDLNDNNVKKSLLNMTVVGIMLGNSSEQSQVIIRSHSGDEKTYMVNDELPGGALIKRITEQGVLVERNNALESLSLPKDELTFDPAIKPMPLNEE